MKSIPLILITAVLAFGQGTVFRSGQPTPPTSFDCSADGTVVNSITGEPIPRAHVTVTPNGTAGYSAVTDSSGKWALSNIGCATALLQVTRPGFLERLGAKLLTLTSGSPVHDVKTALTPQSVAFGKVLDDQGDPVMGAQVTAMASHVMNGRRQFQPAGTGAANDLGEYRIANLPRGKYILCVHFNPPGGPAQAATIPADTCYPGPVEGGIASAMDLPAGRESKVDFTLSEVSAVHIRGTITGLPEGRGNAGVNLVKRSSDEVGPGWPYGIVPGTMRDGKFDFRVPPGSYALTSDYFEGGKRLTARVPVDVGATDIDNVVVHLDGGFTVTGVVRVVSQSGRNTAPQFGVTLRPTEGSVTGQIKWDPDHTSFAINETMPGGFRLDVNPPAPFYVKSATLAGLDIQNNEVPISQAAGPIEIVLRDDGGSIEGDVVDANGQPVSAGILLLRGAVRAAGLTSQASGHFKLQNVAPGDYTIYAWDDPNEVQYADPDWMRRNGGGGTAVTVSAGQSQQIKLTQQLVSRE